MYDCDCCCGELELAFRSSLAGIGLGEGKGMVLVYGSQEGRIFELLGGMDGFCLIMRRQGLLVKSVREASMAATSTISALWVCPRLWNGALHEV